MIEAKQHCITRDLAHCGGEFRVHGTRVTLRAILASLAEGERPEEIVRAFPSLCLKDVHAAIAFAAENAPVIVLSQRCC